MKADLWKSPGSKFAIVAVFTCALFIVSGIVTAQSGGTFNLVWHSIDSGAGNSVGGTFFLRGTIGQPDGDLLVGGEFTLQGGVSRPINSTVVVPPSGPVVAPGRNFFVTRNVPLAWNRVSWATGYEIQVSRTTIFNATTFVYRDANLSADTLSVVTPPLMDNGTYYWRVCAKRAPAVCIFSPTQSFIVNAP
jgi:hypothetical protein